MKNQADSAKLLKEQQPLFQLQHSLEHGWLKASLSAWEWEEKSDLGVAAMSLLKIYSCMSYL